jgi:hypothetical protein
LSKKLSKGPKYTIISGEETIIAIAVITTITLTAIFETGLPWYC